MKRATTVLERLGAVRRTGHRRWVARCPAHDDRRPSLSIREADDGRLLLYCFAGCGALDVLGALGLDWCDLFPPREAWSQATATSSSSTGRRPPPIPARDALEILDHEALVLEIIAHRLAEGEPIERHGADLQLAATRIAKVRAAWRAAP